MAQSWLTGQSAQFAQIKETAALLMAHSSDIMLCISDIHREWSDVHWP